METQQITATVLDIFIGADERDWTRCRQAFAEKVALDYTSMAGGEPAVLPADTIIESWKGFLPRFQATHHQLGNFVINEKGRCADVFFYGTATHYSSTGNDKNIWTVVGTYNAGLEKIADEWKVTALKFNLKYQDGTPSPEPAQQPIPTAPNKTVVDQFFIALETQNFGLLKEIFAEDARQLNPYVPEGFPKSFDGREGIYRQYSSLPQLFGQMKFPRTIYSTEDPDFIFVQFRGQIAIKAGGVYENDYLGTFRLANGRIVEYTEYFNPIVMAKAFGIGLK
jgi:ketosteroid isomerase-like protein